MFLELGAVWVVGVVDAVAHHRRAIYRLPFGSELVVLSTFPAFLILPPADPPDFGLEVFNNALQPTSLIPLLSQLFIQLLHDLNHVVLVLFHLVLFLVGFGQLLLEELHDRGELGDLLALFL